MDYEKIALFRSMSESLPYGVVLARDNLEVILLNAQAQNIVDIADGIAVESGGLVFNDPQADAAVRSMLKRETATAGYRRMLAARRPSHRAPYGVAADHIGSGLVTLRLIDPEFEMPRAAKRMMTLWGLTEAEGDLLSALCHGHTLPQAAARRGISEGTARNQLKQIYLKTETTTQSTAVAKAMRYVANV